MTRFWPHAAANLSLDAFGASIIIIIVTFITTSGFNYLKSAVMFICGVYADRANNNC